MMKSSEIIKLLDNLIGAVEPDETRYSNDEIDHNVGVTIDIVNWCFDGLRATMEYRHDIESEEAREIGERAFAALCEWRDWLTEEIENAG